MKFQSWLQINMNCPKIISEWSTICRKSTKSQQGSLIVPKNTSKEIFANHWEHFRKILVCFTNHRKLPQINFILVCEFLRITKIYPKVISTLVTNQWNSLRIIPRRCPISLPITKNDQELPQRNFKLFHESPRTTENHLEWSQSNLRVFHKSMRITPNCPKKLVMYHW